MKLNKDLIYIGFGVLFEKALPFILTFFFIKKIDDQEYGLWVLYFQFVLIFSSTIISPVQLFFNREFRNTYSDRLNIYNSHIILPTLLFFLAVLFIFYDVALVHSALCLFTIISLTLNNLLFNYLRFKGKNLTYFIFSLFRFFCFNIILISSVFYYNKIDINSLFIAYIVSNMIVIFFFKKIVVLKTKKYKIHEFIKLCIYGLLTLSLGGIDKLVLLNTNLTIMDLAVLGYALVFANSTSIVVEAFKKYFSPIYFKDFNDFGFYSNETIKKTLRANIFLGFFQISFPFLLFFIIDFFDFSKDSLIGPDFFFLLFLLSFSLFVHNIYHFINPFLFYINKSHYLSIGIFIIAFLFTVIVVNIEELNLIKVSFVKIMSSIVLILICFISMKFLKFKKYV